MSITALMDQYLQPDDRVFRDDLRVFFRNAVPARIRAKVSAGQPLTRDEVVESHRILNAAGYAVSHWPVEWGGRDWTPIRRYLFVEELQCSAVPLPLQFNCNMVGPVIATFGSEDQKRRFLPRAANLDDWWCQGFSEPGAGSDLASLRTRAVRDGDHYVVDGQKAWTSYAQYADWIFCLVRTDPAARKQLGISFLLIDMTSPGIEVRPVITMDGRHEVNEVFFDSVRVPVENLVGKENQGWEYAKFLLANERSGIARIGLSKERIGRARTRARATGRWKDPVFRAAVHAVEVDLKALELTQFRILSRDRGTDSPDPASSILKLKGAELQQQATELWLQAEGEGALRALSDPARCDQDATDDTGPAAALNAYLNFRKVSIYGGSNEIQRTIIARTILNI